MTTWAELKEQMLDVLGVQPYQIKLLFGHADRVRMDDITAVAQFNADIERELLGIIEGTFVEVNPPEMRLGSGVDDASASG